MSDIQIVPFSDDLLPQAGELLSARHRCDRAAQPVLPGAFESHAVAQLALETCFKRPHTRGVAALQNSRLVGYLIGELVIADVWGRSSWIRPSGYALQAEQDIELLRRLYAALGSHWVEMGVYFHFAQVLASDTPTVDAFFRLSFGLEQVHALANLADLDLAEQPLPPGLTIRSAGLDDRDLLVEMSTIIWQHQVGAPVWGIHLPEYEPEHRLEYASLVTDPEATLWLAFLNGEPAGIHCYFPAEYSSDNLHTPLDCVELAVAGTYPQFRGLGIGSALTRHGLSHARQHGYRYCLTDWRSTNLLSSTFWPRQGFQPTLYRLVRRVDPRIAWGK